MTISILGGCMRLQVSTSDRSNAKRIIITVRHVLHPREKLRVKNIRMLSRPTSNGVATIFASLCKTYRWGFSYPRDTWFLFVKLS